MSVTLYHEILGEGEPLLFLCGLATHHLIWKESLGGLAKKFKVIIADPRGVGRSPSPPPPYTIEMMAEDYIALLDHLKIDSLSMMGSSMGALILQHLCLYHPQRVKRAILLTPFAKLPETACWQLRTTGKLLAQGVALETVIESVLPWLYSNSFLSNKEKIDRVIKAKLNNPYPQSPEGFQGQGSALLSADYRAEISKITHKILILAGEEDLLTPLACARELAEKIPGAEIKTFPGIGHMLPAEAPAEVIKAAIGFLGH